MKLKSIKLSDYIANLYQTKLGYSYKIYYKTQTANNCVARSYVYFKDQNLAISKMLDNLNDLISINKTLLDFDKL